MSSVNEKESAGQNMSETDKFCARISRGLTIFAVIWLICWAFPFIAGAALVLFALVAESMGW